MKKSVIIEPQHDKTHKMTYAPDRHSLISLRCPHKEALGPWLPIEFTGKTDQTG